MDKNKSPTADYIIDALRAPSLKETAGEALACVQAMAQFVPNALFCKRIDGTYLFCNDAFASLLGRPLDDIHGHTDFELFPSRVANRFFTWESELLHGSTLSRLEVKVPGPDGTELTLIMDRQLLRDASGEPAGFVGTAVDVTSDRREQRERNMTLVMAAAADMAIQSIEGMIDPVIILNADGTVERVNRGYLELFGGKRPALGSSLAAVIPSFSENECVQLLRRCREQGRLRNVAASVSSQDGASLPVLVNISLLKDSQRAIDGFIIAIRDISSVLEANGKLDAILNASEDPVYLVDAQGTIKACNRAMAERSGASPEALVGTPLSTLKDAAASQAGSDFIRDIVDSGKGSRAEFEQRERTYLNSGFPIFDSNGNVREVAVFSYDISEQKQGERLQRALYSISEAAYFAHDMHNLFHNVHRIVARLIPAECVFIALLNSRTGQMECPYYVDSSGEAAEAAARELALGDGLVQYMIGGGESLLLKSSDIRSLRQAGKVAPLARDNREWLGVPLRNGEGEVIGALVTQTEHESVAYRENDRKILNFVSSQIAMAIERKQNEEELRSMNQLLKGLTDGTILALVKAVELRDPYTAGHQQRVSRLASSLALSMGLPAERIEATRMAALLHDVGKISVPSELLSKPGCLSTLEYELIRQHPIVSSDILKSIDFPYPIARFVREHHEKMDGSGYPEGLKGDEISLESRIICVADVVDAMVSHRPYRPSRGLELALGEIKRNSGVLYDEDVARSCAELFSSGAFCFEEEPIAAWMPWRA